jgi:hypothetical protein
VQAFVDNFLDEQVKSTKLISSPLLGAPAISSYYPPRTWGVRFGATW